MVTGVRVRPMLESDFALVDGWRSDPRLGELGDELGRGGEIIELDGEPVGWIDPHPAYAPAWRELLGPDVGEHPWTLDLFVIPEHWNKGIARSAIRSVSERCLASGATCMVVDVAPANAASCRAFVGAGWSVVPTVEEDVILRYPPTEPTPGDRDD